MLRASVRAFRLIGLCLAVGSCAGPPPRAPEPSVQTAAVPPPSAPAPSAGAGWTPRATYGFQIDAPKTLRLGERRTLGVLVLPDGNTSIGEVEVRLASDPAGRLVLEPGRAQHRPDGSTLVPVKLTAREPGAARVVGWIVPTLCVSGGSQPRCQRAPASAVDTPLDVSVPPAPGAPATAGGVATDPERWRAAIDSYTSRVQPGNQTSLNAARVPFASYLNAIHHRLHDVFAEQFLGALDAQPPLPSPASAGAPVVSVIEMVLTPERGTIETMGVVRSSGMRLFDAVALTSLARAAPFGKAPDSIVSADGRVYVHWQFHRDPFEACSTRNARPFLLTR